MIVYRSPHLQLVNQAPLRTKLQSTGEQPIIPECNDQSSCNNDPTFLGVNQCVGSSEATFQVTALLPGTSCASAPTCAITNVFLSGTPLTEGSQYTCSDPSLSDCSEGACRVDFNCVITNDVSCNNITAEVRCSGGEPVSCENTIVP